MLFKPLPLLYNAKGNLRTVGFELEFTNVGIEESVQLIQNLYGGKVYKESRFSQKVTDTALGDFKVEFDLTLLTEKGYKKVFDQFDIRLDEVKLGKNTLESEVETMLESIVGKLFPYEIATPPIPFTQLEELEKLRQALYEHNAEGTKAFLTNAFGTHINVEVPNTDTSTILSYLRAFLLLYPWLLEAGKTDLARRISPFIDPYPSGYIALVLDSAYQPNLSNLIKDYHQYNPDRNRPLDMYPLFKALDKDTFSEFNNIGKVKARETFHYRLPNSSISQPDWSLAEEWNYWVAIEELANNKEKLAEMSRDYFSLKKDTLIGFESKWVKKTKHWLSL